MMAAARTPAPPAPLPLLIWEELREVERLRAERDRLRRRMERLSPHCRERIEITARLRAATERVLAAELRLQGEKRG